MKRDQLPESDNIIQNYSEVKTKDVKWLWRSDYYDGPLSGMVELNGNRYWTECFDEEEWTEQNGPDEDDIFRVRFFAILKLTDKQQESEEYWHELFQLCVGKHSDYDISGNRFKYEEHTKETKQFYYTRREMDYEELDLSESNLISWFKY